MAATIEKELEQTQTKWQQTQKELDQTKSELHDIREELERSQSQLDEVLGELEQTHFELHQLKQNGEQQQSHSDGEVNQELDKTKSELHDVREELEQTHFELHQLKQKGEQQQSHSDGEVNQELDKTKSELHDVREELERSQSQLDEVLGELEQTHFELHQLKQKGEQQQSDSDGEVKQELDQTKSELHDVREELEQTHFELHQLKQKGEQQQSHSDGEVKQELDQTKSELHDVREELERSQSQLEQVLGELEQTHFELHQLKQKGEQQQSHSDGEVKQELEETKAKLQETEQLLEQSHSQLGETMGVLEEYQSQMEKTMGTLEESQGKLQQKQEELEQVKAELAQKQSGSESELQKELEETKSQLRESEELLEKYQSQLEETMATLEESHSQLGETMVVLEQSQSQLQQKHQELESTKSELLQTKKELEQVKNIQPQPSREITKNQTVLLDSIPAKGGITGPEIAIIKKFITEGNVIFDVGANVGKWTEEVLNYCSNLKLHLFEPAPQTYKVLDRKITERQFREKPVTNCIGIAEDNVVKQFYYYDKHNVLSTFKRRISIDKIGKYGFPREIKALTTTIDSYCQQKAIRRINFLKVDTEGSELDVLLGAEQSLKRGKIDYIQFEYGGTYKDAKITLKQVFDYLQKYRYSIFKVLENKLEYRPDFVISDEDYQYNNYLAVNERFLDNVLGEKPRLLDVPKLCIENSINPKGVIHVGAHEGPENSYYQKMGLKKILFIEANPVVFERLKNRVASYPNVKAVNYAISNVNGTVDLHITSNEQSSSILPLKKHQEIYPNIKETHQVKVESKKLDTLLPELKLNPSDYNILNIDIQGAELLALQGATNWLRNVDAINTEVNYEELYEGCVLIDELDEFLDRNGFQRVATKTPHPSWGDAFYVKKPLITMSILSRARFGNQIFLYTLLKIHQKEHDVRVETVSWVGQYLFGHNDPQISRTLPEFADSGMAILNAKEPFKNVEFSGPVYQLHTKYYAPYKDFIRTLFQPVPQVEVKMRDAVNKLRERGNTIVGIHLRRGDYQKLKRSYTFVAPTACYKKWLEGLWETLEKPILFIASDELAGVVDDFADYNPITIKDLGIQLPEADFYPEFYVLTQCDILAISNSTFSFTAAMLNENCKFFFRPHLLAKKLIPFEPWNSEPLYQHGYGTWEEPTQAGDVQLSTEVVTKSQSSIHNFIGQFVNKGDLVFDVGANQGLKTDLYLSIGAKVICFEPQPHCVEILNQKYQNNQNVAIVNKGLATKSGQLELSICDRADVLSTFSEQWKTGRFANQKWEKKVTVEVTTLDEMIKTWGLPQFCKIDVEGFEYQVLKGLSQPISYLSFEFTIEFIDNAKKSIQHLVSLGYSLFNITQEDQTKLAISEWVSETKLFDFIESKSTNKKSLWGNIYAKY
ncbi:MAG: FkbM family methyltransferase [Okeania sp. SIO3I5]|uniref:FkbM family methyltransferase n=1 Tax=Okeania sp. SIO3I5 TaxID=2607805 RepID=UPI0013BB5C42|nr:FkbM family methyltransferase [Okeania sp. SIO3I5]NEQ35516.1 FkbM family methyltransferase [Okeania sp. SIO3I5]